MLVGCIVAGIMAYLLGSIPFGLVLVRVFRGVDVRKTGSGNIGTANVARVAPGLGLWTLFFDSAKGLVAVLLAQSDRQAHDRRIDSIGGAHYRPERADGNRRTRVSGVVEIQGRQGRRDRHGRVSWIDALGCAHRRVLYVAIYAVWHYTSLASITVGGSVSGDCRIHDVAGATSVCCCPFSSPHLC